MFASMVPVLQVMPVTPPPAADAARAQRSNTIAERGSTREAAERAIRRDRDHAPGMQPEVAEVVPGSQDADATVKVWDVNGDGAKDAVVTDTASGATSALLNRGGDLTPQLETEAVSLSAPTAIDVDRLSVKGDKTGRNFLATDLDGDGVRQTAVERAPGEWISLGPSQDGADGSGLTPIQQAERHFEAIVAELSALLQDFALSRGFSRMLAQRAGGLSDLLNADPGEHAFNGYDVDQHSLGQILLSDPFVSVVAAFAPTDYGILNQSVSAPACATGSRP
jgi:hypothetical protein